jgi:chromosome partitioning protein
MVAAPAAFPSTLIAAVLNEKGGVGKTTTVLNLGYELALRGLDTLLLDLDHRADLTKASGAILAEDQPSLVDALSSPPQPFEHCTVVLPKDTPGRLAILPAERNLAVLHVELATLQPFERPARLIPLLKWGREHFRCILLDAPPGLGPFTSMILGAVDFVIVPQEPSFVAASGVRELEVTLHEFAFAGVSVKVLGILITKVRYTIHHKEYIDRLRERYGELVFDAVIPESVRYQEAPAHGMAIREYLGSGPLVDAYSSLADEVIARWHSGRAHSMHLHR